MSYIRLLTGQSRAFLLVAFALAAAGVVAALSLPIGLFPQVAFPRVVVDVDAGSRPADQTALTVTRPIEQALRAVQGVQDVRSETTRGSAQVSIDFGWGRDMTASTLLVDAAMARALGQLPAGVTYNVRRMDPTVFPIISYALESDRASPVALQDFARYQVVPLLSGITGLARVDVQGGETAEVEVLADPARLAAHGLAMSDLSTAIASGNVLSAVGRVQDRGRLSLVIADRTITSAAQIADVVVKADPAGVVRVRDVAAVEQGVVPQWLRVVEDGKPAVLFNIYQQPDGNSVRVARDVQAKLAGLKLPPGTRLVNWYDQSELVTRSVASVRDAVLIGLVLAALVLLVFLRNWRITLVAVIVVPATLAATVLVLMICGMSFNIMTLGGIAAAVGLLIDDVIVMVEHIVRRAAAPAGDGPRGAAAVLPASREFMVPLTGSSLATLIVFLPLSFLSGITGAFSKALSLTMAAALAISWAMTAFVVPSLARRLVDFDRVRDPGAAGEGRLARVHDHGVDAVLARPWLLALVAVPLLVVGYVGYTHVPTGFMPKVDEGGFVMDYYTKPGTSLDETGRQIGQVDAMLSADPDVLTFSRRLGTGLGGDLGQSYHGDYFVRLKAGHAKPTDEVAAAVADRVAREVPGVSVEVAQLMEDLIGDLTAVPQPIEVKLYAADPAILYPQAKKVAALIGGIDGVVEVKDGVQLAGDAIDVRIDPIRAAFQGVTPAEVQAALDAALTGLVATSLPQPTKAVDVRVRLPDMTTITRDGLARLPIRAGDGHVLTLSQVADLRPVVGQPQISRENLEPMVAVTGRIQGRGISAAVGDVTTALDRPGVLAPGVRYELGGLYQQQQIAFTGLAKVFVAALIAEFVLLLVLYRRFALPFVIIGCSLLSTTAVFTALWLTGVDLNITALMGMTMIIGIGTEMAIFYVSEFEELARHMPVGVAAREASRNRLRPITMTTLAAILTLLPLALAIGQGSGIQQPLAIAIIAGLLLQYPLVLVAMPALVRLVTPARRPACPPEGTSMKIKTIALPLAGLLAATAAHADPAPYTLAKTVQLGAPDRWDYVVFDAGTHRVYVAHGDRVTVVDAASGAIVGDVAGIPGGTHGTAVSMATGQGFTDDGKNGKAVMFDLKTLKITRQLPADEDADAIALDRATGHVFVIEGDPGAITVIDPRTLTVAATIKVGEKLEYAAGDDHGILYVAGEANGDVVKIDARTNKLVAHWPTPDCRSPHGIAVDRVGHRVFLGCINSVMMVVDSDSGRIVAKLPIGRGSDAVAFDPVRRRAFSSNGADGTISVYQQTSAGGYRALGPVTTSVSGRTMSVDPDTGRLFVAAADTDPSPTPGVRPKVRPGTLKLLMFDPVP